MIAKRLLSYSAVVFVFSGGPIPPTPFPTRKGGAAAVPHFLAGGRSCAESLNRF